MRIGKKAKTKLQNSFAKFIASGGDLSELQGICLDLDLDWHEIIDKADELEGK
tara:strand:- start:375 stop:533 length:159 start_codon:yes stop_codon:yes gene_type:complete